MKKLTQIVAVEKGVKGRVYGAVTELHKAAQKAELYNGFHRVYRKKDDQGEDFPPERRIVQLEAEGVLQQVAHLLTELCDVTAAKDLANCNAVANVLVDGEVLLDEVPVTYLLFLEKQLTDLRTFVDKMPVLDESEEWTRDENAGLFKSEPVATHKTKKTQRPIVLYDATDKHPAQTQLITDDVIVGYWDTVKLSGALPKPRKAHILARVDELLKAVKFAREEANDVEALPVRIGEKVFGYLFA